MNNNLQDHGRRTMDYRLLLDRDLNADGPMDVLGTQPA
jgi:hypothetical protein